MAETTTDLGFDTLLPRIEAIETQLRTLKWTQEQELDIFRQLQTLQGGSGTLEPQSTISAWDGPYIYDETVSATNGVTYVGEAQYLLAGIGIQFTRVADSPFLQIDGIGGALDCLADIVVSECWADEVDAGRGEEGQLVKTFSGCNLYMVSTVQYAWDGVGDMLVANGGPGGAKDFENYCIVFICPGDAGPLAITTDGGDDTTVTFVGMGEGSQINHATGGQTAVSITGGTRPLIFRDLLLGAVADTAPLVSSSNAQQTISFDTVTFGVSNGRTPVLDSASGLNFTFTNCFFAVNQASAWAFDNALNANDTKFKYCTFNDRVRPGAETYFLGCRFNCGTNTTGVDATSEGLHVWVQSCEFRGGQDFARYIDCDGTTGAGTLHVVGNVASRAASSEAIRIADGFLSGGGSTHTVTGNIWRVAVGIRAAGTDVLERLNYSSNQHYSANPGYAPFAYAIGRFENCTFEANGPSTAYVSFTASSGINNVNGSHVGSGAPSHTASESQQYWDSSANTFYINTDGSTTWAVIGVAGGGAAAPSPHDFVGTHHDHDTDYTQTPNVDGIGVGGGDIDLYSDNGSTQTGEWDGATGHIGLGAGSLAQTNNTLYTNEVYQDPASSLTGASMAMQTQIQHGPADGTISRSHIANYLVAEIDLDRLSTSLTLNGEQKALVSGFLVNFGTTGVTVAQATAWAPTIATLGDAGGTLTTGRGIHIVTPAIVAGAITTFYGIDIDSISGATTNIGIRNQSTLRQVGAMTLGADAAVTSGLILDITGTVGQKAAGVYRFYDSDDSNYVGLKAPATAQSENWVIALPDDDPVAGEAMIADSVSSPNVTTKWKSGASAHTYVFIADVAIDTNVTTGDNQGGIFHHSYNSTETVKRIITEFEVAPTGSAATIQLEYGDTDDLDTVASWTEIESQSHTAAAKTIIATSSFTNSTIPANRLIRMNVDAVGSTEPGENLTVHLQVERPLVWT